MYFSPDQMRTALGDDSYLHLVDSDSDGVLGEKDHLRLESAILEACSFMDSLVAPKYGVPLASKYITPIFVMHCRNVAVHILQDNGVEMSELIQTRYDAAERWGSKVATGKVRLGNTAKEPEKRLPAATSSTDTRRRKRGRATTRTITRSTMKGLL